MKRYINLYLQFIKNAVIKESMFRVNFLSHTIAELIHVSIGILGLHIIFGQITSLAGWNYHEILLLYGIASIIRGLYFGPFIQNMGQLMKHINKGTLDFVLLKPISSQFYVSTRKIRLFSITPLLSGAWIAFLSIDMLNIAPKLSTVVFSLVLIIVSVFLCYAMWFISVIPAIWFPQVRELHEIFISLYSFSRYPPEIFSKSAARFFTYVIPLLVIAVIPTKVILGKSTLSETLWLPTATVFLLFLSRHFWRYALRHYSSASS